MRYVSEGIGTERNDYQLSQEKDEEKKKLGASVHTFFPRIDWRTGEQSCRGLSRSFRKSFCWSGAVVKDKQLCARESFFVATNSKANKHGHEEPDFPLSLGFFPIGFNPEQTGEQQYMRPAFPFLK